MAVGHVDTCMCCGTSVSFVSSLMQCGCILGGGAQMQLGRRSAYNAGMRCPQPTHAFDMQGVVRQLSCVSIGVPAVAVVDWLSVLMPLYGLWLSWVARALVCGVLLVSCGCLQLLTLYGLPVCCLATDITGAVVLLVVGRQVPVLLHCTRRVLAVAPGASCAVLCERVGVV
jgi:hypothetical protein